MSDNKVMQVLLDPEWQWGSVQIEDVSLPIITLLHPAHGPITSIVPVKAVHEIIAGLTKLVMTKQ
ncbi:MAG: hypothetical protein WC829_01340 [Hyphomicrobium sp.]|jgi:hypothetical protein